MPIGGRHRPTESLVPPAAAGHVIPSPPRPHHGQPTPSLAFRILLTAYCRLPTQPVASSKVGCYTSLNSASSLKIADAPHPDAILRFKAPERCPSG